MTEFAHEIHTRIADTRLQLQLAREADEPYLTEVRLGELESLARLARDHGIVVDGLDRTLAEFGGHSPATGRSPATGLPPAPEAAQAP